MVLLEKIRALLSHHPGQNEIRYLPFRLSFMQESGHPFNSR